MKKFIRWFINYVLGIEYNLTDAEKERACKIALEERTCCGYCNLCRYERKPKDAETL